jgi:hypothetical protein
MFFSLLFSSEIARHSCIAVAAAGCFPRTKSRAGHKESRGAFTEVVGVEIGAINSGRLQNNDLERDSLLKLAVGIPSSELST